MALKSLIKEIYPDVKYVMIKNRIEDFLKRCVGCNKKLSNFQDIAKLGNDNIIELKFCSECYKKYENLSIDQLPKHIREKIQKYLKDSEELGM